MCSQTETDLFTQVLLTHRVGTSVNRGMCIHLFTSTCAYAPPQVHHIGMLIHTRRRGKEADEQVDPLVVRTIDPCAVCLHGKVI